MLAPLVNLLKKNPAWISQIFFSFFLFGRLREGRKEGRERGPTLFPLARSDLKNVGARPSRPRAGCCRISNGRGVLVPFLVRSLSRSSVCMYVCECDIPSECGKDLMLDDLSAPGIQTFLARPHMMIMMMMMAIPCKEKRSVGDSTFSGPFSRARYGCHQYCASYSVQPHPACPR